MKIVISPQAFKGSLNALDASRAIEKGIKRIWPGASIILHPVADGGDGTLEICKALLEARIHHTLALNASGQRKKIPWALIPGKTAVIESASICGLASLPINQRNPLRNTTYGIGQAIRSALDKGCRRIILGIGGTATHDGGRGLAEALGIRFLDRRGNPLLPGPAPLRKLEEIDFSGLDPRVAKTEFIAACDVFSPLLGPKGATLYAEQKGADKKMIEKLEMSMSRYCEVLKKQVGAKVKDLKGGGAGGGLGLGAYIFLNAQVCSGADLLLEMTGFDRIVQGASLVITGEGRLDRQTLNQKAPYAVAVRAAKQQIPVIAIVGSFSPEFFADKEKIISAAIPLSFYDVDPDNYKETFECLTQAAEQAARLCRLGFGLQKKE